MDIVQMRQCPEPSMFTTNQPVSPENRKTFPSGIGRLDKFTWKLEIMSGYHTTGDIEHNFNFTRFQCLAEKKKEGSLSQKGSR